MAPSGYHTFSGAYGKDEIVLSQGNPYHLLGKSGRRIGGDFLVIKHEFGDGGIPSRAYSNFTNPNQNNAAHYHGPVTAIDGLNYTNWPLAIIPTSNELDYLGTQAISNTLPTNPLSGLFVTLGELKSEGIPSLSGVSTWQNRTRYARSAGDEFLNYQFGWLPLVNELKAFTHSVRDSHELIRRYERNSGRKIKRSFNLPTKNTISSGPASDAYPKPAMSEIYVNIAETRPRTQTVRQTTDMWFEACYTYYLPPYNPGASNLKRNEQLANYLYGTRPTPEGVWNLTPWTWAADWVGNFGNVLHNVSAFQQDGLTMQYAYLMYKTVHEVTISHNKVRFKSYGGEANVSATYRTIAKGRRTASPYGFGLNPNTFSDRQWAILAALGLSRGSRQLYS